MTDEVAEQLVKNKAISEELAKQIPLLESANDKANEMANAFNYGAERLSQMSNLADSVSGALSKF